MSLPIDNAARERAISDLDTTLLVEAAAGTGKTTLAIERILQAVRTNRAKMEEIVAITFTEKAAAELKIRLRDRMEEARKAASGAERDRLGEGVRQLERSHVKTIHGFCSWLLKERPIEAGVDPSFQVLDALETQLLQEKAWREWIDQQMEQPPEVLKRALFAELDLAKLRQIAFDLVARRDRVDLRELKPSPYTVADGIAELGAILAKLKPKLANCVDRSDAAFEQIQRLLDLFARIEAMPSDHRFAQEYELIHSIRVKMNAGAQKNWDDKDSLKAIKDAYESLNAIPARRGAALLRDLAAWLREFADAFARRKRRLGALDFDDLLIQTRQLLLERADVRVHFQRRFRFLLVDEFQDTDPTQTEIIFLLAEHGAEAKRWEDARLQPGKLFLVGDPKQSIYRFRRADIETYAAAKQRICDQGAVLHIQQSFRAASSLLAWVDETFVQLIHPPEDGGMYQPEYVRLHPSPERQTRSAQVCILEPTDEQRKMIAEKGGIDAVRSFETREVARLIEHLVRSGEWKMQGRGDPEARPPRYRDFAILLHSPATSLAGFEEAFQQQGIPYQVEGGKDYFQSQEVRAVCALLLVLDDPMNTGELVGILRSAIFGFSDEEIYLWAKEHPLDYLEEDSTQQSAVSSQPTIGRVHDLSRMETRHPSPDLSRKGRGEQNRNEKPISSPLAEEDQGEGSVPRQRQDAPQTIGDAFMILRNLHEQRNGRSFAGFLELIYRELKLPESFSLRPHGDQCVANLMKLLSIARKLQDANLLSLREFVNHLRTTALDRSEEGQSPSAEAQDDVVSILSIHKAKGLEWGVTIIGDLGGIKRPHPPLCLVSRDSDQIGYRLGKEMQTENYEALQAEEKVRQNAEEARLLYVAATRARDYLVLPWFAEKGHYLELLKRAFDPARAGEAVATFFRHHGGQSIAVLPGSAEPARVELSDPDLPQRCSIERWMAERVEWQKAQTSMLARLNEGRKRVTPSRLMEMETDERMRRRSPKTAAVADQAALFGTIMHETLAKMNFQQPEKAEELWRVFAERDGLPADDIQRGLEMTRRFMGTELFRKVLHAREIHRELPFAYQRGDTLVEGIVDLLFRTDDEWFLVDFKTDQVAVSEVILHAERYRPQLDAYAKAVETIGGMRPAKILMLLWPMQEVRLG